MLETIVNYVNIFFMYYILIYAIVFFISTISSVIYLDKSNLRRKFSNNIRIKNNENYIPISILVPAYNEEETVADCIKSILSLDYREYEVVIINDGSTDNTSAVLIDEFKLKKVMRPIRILVECKKEISVYEGIGKNNIKITLINKSNGGKADSLNMGINVCKYPFFISLDADSILQRDSLNKIVVPFMEDEVTVAVGGNIKVANQVILKNGEVVKTFTPKKLIVILQIIEYYRVFLTTRVWLNKFNGNLIISGAFGMFDKRAVINVGGYNSTSIGEDMDLVVKIHSFYRKNEIPYKIQYAHDAICWSQVPDKIKDLATQRKRWQMGLMSSIITHKYIFLNIKYGVVGMFSFLYFIVYEMLSCIIDIFGLAFILLSYSMGFINIEFLILFMMVYIGYSFVISVTSIILENCIFKHQLSIKSIFKLILFSFIENFGYRQICSWYRLVAIFGYKKNKHKWNKIKREKHNYIDELEIY